MNLQENKAGSRQRSTKKTTLSTYSVTKQKALQAIPQSSKGSKRTSKLGPPPNQAVKGSKPARDRPATIQIKNLVDQNSSMSEMRLKGPGSTQHAKAVTPGLHNRKADVGKVSSNSISINHGLRYSVKYPSMNHESLVLKTEKSGAQPSDQTKKETQFGPTKSKSTT